MYGSCMSFLVFAQIATMVKGLFTNITFEYFDIMGLHMMFQSKFPIKRHGADTTFL